MGVLGLEQTFPSPRSILRGEGSEETTVATSVLVGDGYPILVFERPHRRIFISVWVDRVRKMRDGKRKKSGPCVYDKTPSRK